MFGHEAILGLLIPFIGTSTGVACVFFMKKNLSSSGGFDRICGWRDDGCVHLEPADKIVVLADGKVAEEGSPSELRSNERSMFRHMAELQASSAGWSI